MKDDTEGRFESISSVIFTRQVHKAESCISSFETSPRAAAVIAPALGA
jgi:hypothetical protein